MDIIEKQAMGEYFDILCAVPAGIALGFFVFS